MRKGQKQTEESKARMKMTKAKKRAKRLRLKGEMEATI